MMSVPSYQLLPFLAWLHRRGIRVSNERVDYDRLDRLAEEFLQANGESTDGNLAWLMAMFQSCPMIQESSIEEQFYHFAGCGSCIEHIRELGGWRPSCHFHEGDGYPWPVERYSEGPWERGRRFDENTQPLGSNESLEQAARRLSDSVRLAMESGFYDDLIAKEPQIARLFSLVMESSKHLPQTLTFLDWLRRREPNLRIQGSIPASEFATLALQFCEELGYSNGQSFSQEARQWLGGGGTTRIIDRITKFLSIDCRSRSTKRDKRPRNPLDRYGAVRFHGLFLFLSSDDFPAFIDRHWRDLHHLTGDDLDIYFSQKDLGERTSGYEIVTKLKSVSLRVDSIPALLLWEDVLEEGAVVPLHTLDHLQVVEVVKTVVQAIRDECTLNDVRARGTAKASELQHANRQAVLVESRGPLFINNGGVMGGIYCNRGVVGAMGENPVAHDNVFVQDARKVLSEVPLTAADAPVVLELAEILASSQVQGVTLAARLEGAKHLAALAESAKAGQVLDEPLAGWKKWMSSLGERTSAVLSVLADIVTVTSPVARVLGLPM